MIVLKSHGMGGEQMILLLHYIFLFFSDKPDGVPDVTKPVNEREELCVMFRAQLNNHSLLFGAEMDGVNSTSMIDSCSQLAEAKFIELKTSRHIETPQQDRNFRR
jgi:RAT1-interacting protein